MKTTEPPIRVAAIGLNHPHIYGMTHAVVRAGAQLVAVHAQEDDLVDAYRKVFPQAERVADRRAILEDRSIDLVLSAIVPDLRAATAIEAMRDHLGDIDFDA